MFARILLPFRVAAEVAYIVIVELALAVVGRIGVWRMRRRDTQWRRHWRRLLDE